MLINVEGRVNNIHLPRTMPLLPLFEAITNSFDALEDYLPQPDPKIHISIKRDKTQIALSDEDAVSCPISGFIIKDNGPGFDQENFDSFRTSDSTLKIRKGGKGIGRFLWLKAFESVSIDSVYHNNGSFLRRQFKFTLSSNGVEEAGEPVLTAEPILKTEVHLEQFRVEYKQNCPKKSDTIAHKIIQHFLTIFMFEEKCPRVLLLDDEAGTINLNDLFHAEYKAQSKTKSFSIKGEPFSIASVRIKSSDPSNHRLSFCASNREVMTEQLKDSIPDLDSKLTADDGNPFVYQAFVSGALLNSRVNPERTDFNIPKKTLPLDTNEITLADIRQSALSEIRIELEPYLTPIQKQKFDRVKNYIHSEAPQYRHVLKYGSNQIVNIAPDLPDNSLEIELYKIHQGIELDVKQQSKNYLDTKITDIRKYPEYREKYAQFIEKLNDVGKANIAKYIVHRKIVLDLLGNTLKRRNDDAYALEENIHGIIFPLRSTSDDVSYSLHNLWILDEKLAYHFFLASDKKLSQIGVLESESSSRCDLIVFNNPCAFVDEKDEFSSVVIIEFKRPMRNDYSADDDNPINQVYGYVRELRSQKKLDKDGRVVPITENTPIYTFIVCDLTTRMKELAQNASLGLTLDGKGYFGFNKELQTYVEVLSYDKILADAQKRNRVLFDQLHIT